LGIGAIFLNTDVRDIRLLDFKMSVSPHYALPMVAEILTLSLVVDLGEAALGDSAALIVEAFSA
jgi:hypothetical protein